MSAPTLEALLAGAAQRDVPSLQALEDAAAGSPALASRALALGILPLLAPYLSAAAAHALQEAAAAALAALELHVPDDVGAGCFSYGV